MRGLFTGRPFLALRCIFRFELVPKVVKEEEFWRNYLYRVSLIKQSFELKDMERSGTSEGQQLQPVNETKAVKAIAITSETSAEDMELK